MTDEEILALFDEDPLKATAKLSQFREALTWRFERRGFDDPEGMAQETILRGWKCLRGGARLTVSDPRAFFYGIAKNVEREELRGIQYDELAEDPPDRPVKYLGLNATELAVLARELDDCLTDGERSELALYLRGGDGARLSGASRLRIFRIRRKIRRIIWPSEKNTPEGNTQASVRI